MSRAIAVSAFAFALSGVACALSFPDYDLEEGSTSATSSSTGSGDAGGGGSAPLLPDGEACASNAECFSGQCLPSNTDEGTICCAVACPEMAVESCGLNGKCDASGADCALHPAGADCGGDAITCAEGLQTKMECRAGACLPAEPAPCDLGLVCAGAAACQVECEAAADCANPGNNLPVPDCVGGACVDRPAGAPCDSNDECSSGFCGAAGTGRCCKQECPGVGDECGPIDCDLEGACIFQGTDTPCGSGSTCADGVLKSSVCNGEGACGWERVQQCAGHLGCASPTSCHSSCGSNDATGDAFCAAGFWCDGATCQMTSWTEGNVCLRDGQCRSGDCSPAGRCAGVACDFDQDGALRNDPPCGGTDCDDGDARVYLGQTAFFETPRASGGYDFDCNGSDEPQAATSCLCSGTALLVPGGPGGCGMTGPIRKCFQFFVCQFSDTADTGTQLCR